jgi:predicted enzyme related to lactoylglutathione lyase
MPVIGIHNLLYSSEPEKLRAVLRNVFGWQHVNAGQGWLIFALPPTEMGVHPAEGPTYEAGARHLISFMCDDIEKTITELRAKGIEIKGDPQDEGYGITVTLGLPGGAEVMLYEPRHKTAIPWPNKP